MLTIGLDENNQFIARAGIPEIIYYSFQLPAGGGV